MTEKHETKRETEAGETERGKKRTFGGKVTRRGSETRKEREMKGKNKEETENEKWRVVRKERREKR